MIWIGAYLSIGWFVLLAGCLRGNRQQLDEYKRGTTIHTRVMAGLLAILIWPLVPFIVIGGRPK